MNEPRTTDGLALSVFKDASPILHDTLVSFYRFMEEEAEAFEETLLVWLIRLGRRSANRAMPAAEMRAQLLYVACKYARAFQIARFKGIEPAEEKFTMALAQSPEEVVTQLLDRL